MADESEIRSLAARAQALAVARYLSDDPNAVGRAGPFLDAEAEAWRGRGADAIAQEASEALDALEEWAERVRDERPELFETRRTDYLHAKLALGPRGPVVRHGGRAALRLPAADGHGPRPARHPLGATTQ